MSANDFEQCIFKMDKQARGDYLASLATKQAEALNKEYGKVERSHRKDQEWLYSKRESFSLKDFNQQLRRYNRQYNSYPMRPRNWKSPNEVHPSFF